MHELSLATELIRQVLGHAAENNLARVDEVELEVGILKQVVPEAMQMAWKAVTEGTIAEGAELRLTEIPPSAQCRKCQRVFELKIDHFLCPECNEADVEILSGNEMILKSLSGEQTQGEAVR